MKKTTFIYSLIFYISLCQFAFGQTSDYTLKVFDKVVFYDGYAATTSQPVPEGVTRLDNTRYAKKFAESERESILNTLEIDVTIGALCDNYDRIGGVFISLVPKDEPITSETNKLLKSGGLSLRL